MSELENVTVLVLCPECGRPTGPPVKPEMVTVEMPEMMTARIVPVESLQVRDDLIYSLQQLLACYRAKSRPKGNLLDRIEALRNEHEKLMQADR